MNRTIFPRPSLDRRVAKWEEFVPLLTPVELTDGRWYKREDYFAPLGYGGINGSKLRQLIGLINRAKAVGILTGASVLSPQLSMTSLVARHYGLPTRIVLGGTRPDTAFRHENVAIAAAAGAEFSFLPVGYNPALQREVRRLGESPEYAGWLTVKYGITNNHPDDENEVAWFHGLGARQVANIPVGVSTVVMTAGSCNSMTSVLYGLARVRPPGLKRIVLFGIGPNKFAWAMDRLAKIERAVGHPIASVYGNGADQYRINYHDLHTAKYVTYGDRKPFSHDGIDFHPTYEGKMMAYMAEFPAAFDWFWHAQGEVLVWIVGSEPRRAVIEPALREVA